MALSATEKKRLANLTRLEADLNPQQRANLADLRSRSQEIKTDPTPENVVTPIPAAAEVPTTPRSKVGRRIVDLPDGTAKLEDELTSVEKGNVLAKEMGFAPDLFLTEQQQAKKLQTDLERQAAEAKRLRDIEQARQREQTSAVRSSTTASMLPSREGPISLAQTSGVQAVGRELTRSQEQFSIQLNQAQQQLEEIQRQKQQAFVSGSIERRELLARQEAETAQKIAEIQDKLLAAEEEARAGALDVAQQAQKSVGSILDSFSPESLAAINPSDLMQLVGTQTELLGLDDDQMSLILGNALARQAIAGQIAKVKSPEEILKLRQAEANLRKTFSDLASPTSDIKNIQFYQQLQSTDPELAEKFATATGLNAPEKLSTIKVGDDVYSFNPVTGEANKVAGPEGKSTIMPTGSLVTGNIGGREVKLDSGAYTALAMANKAAVASGSGDILVSDSTRDQKQTILTMAAKFGVDVADPSNIDQVNQAAAKLTAMGHTVAPVGKSLHEKGLAIDIMDNTPDHSYIKKVKPFLEASGYVQDGGPNDPGHFSFRGIVDAVDPEVKSLVSAIMSGTGRVENLSVKTREQVIPELAKAKEEALKKGDITGVMRASAGGKDMSDTSVQAFQKGVNVITQLGELQRQIEEDDDYGPIVGRLRRLNPYDEKAQELQATLISLTPNLARGIYGEVGVLTDNDVRLYQQTMPNLTQTADIQQAVLALTLRTVKNSIENQVKIQAAAGRDMSGFVDFYQDLDSKIKSIESQIGVDKIKQQETLDSDLQLMQELQTSLSTDETSEVDSIFD